MNEYNPQAPENLADPAARYDILLREQPVYLNQAFDPPYYILSRFDDVEAALRDIRTFSSEFGQGPRFTPPAGMLSDPPQHTYFRGLVQQAFTPKSIAALAPRIEQLAHELIDKIEGRDSFDIHDDYAFPLPVTIIAELMGVPSSDLHKFKKWSDASVEAMGAEDPTPWEAELGRMAAYIMEHIQDRRQNPGDDLITRLVQVEQDGHGLDDAQILSVCNQLLVGGNETTTSLITNVVWRLLEHPDQWQKLTADPGLVNQAIEEGLRFDPPVLGLFRNTTKDVTLHGVTIPRGVKVWLNYAAANRDPAAFDNPNSFDITRKPKRHMSFGLGVHFCLGAELARMEGRTALRVLAERLPNLAFVDEGERIKPFFLWGRKHLPTRVTAKA